MNLELLYHAVELVRGDRYRSNAPEATFLRIYPILLATARLPAAEPADAFLRVASLAYAWMPQTLRLDTTFLAGAVTAFETARGEGVKASERIVEPIAACLSSLVGASKVLHLANPAVFPFWDQRVEALRLAEEPSSYHMGQVRSYLGFIDEVCSLTRHPLFLTFHHDYCTAYQARLQRLRIPAYPLTEPRVVESAASELASP